MSRSTFDPDARDTFSASDTQTKHKHTKLLLMKNIFFTLVLFFGMLFVSTSSNAQFYPSQVNDLRTGWGIGIASGNTSSDLFDNGVDRLVTFVSEDPSGLFNYVLVKDPIWGGIGMYLPYNIKFPDVVIAHSFGANHYILNVTYYDPMQGMVLEQIDYYTGSGFSSSIVTVLDNNLGAAMPTSGPRIDIDQENCHAAIVWHNPAQNVMKTMHINFYLGLSVQSPINTIPLSSNMIEPDVAVTMDDAYFTFLSRTRKDVYMLEMSLNDIDHNAGMIQSVIGMKAAIGFDHYNPRIATSCKNTNNHGDWTIVCGAGVCTSAAIYGWSGTDATLYNTVAHQYTNSFTWSNKNFNKYQMDNGNSLNLYPAVTYQHSNGNSASNFIQIAWQSTDALNNYMGKNAGSTTIVSVTCDRNGNPIPVSATNSVEPEYQIVPHYYSNGAMPSLGDSSGVNNFKSQSRVSLAGRNSIQNDELVVYFDAANGNVNLPTWDEVIIKENVTVSSGFRHESAASVAAVNDVKVRIYPNPVAEHITLESSVSDAAMLVSMFDMNGRLVMRAQGNSAEMNNQLNNIVAGLSNGTYMLQVNSQGALVYNDKIVKMAN